MSKRKKKQTKFCLNSKKIEDVTWAELDKACKILIENDFGNGPKKCAKEIAIVGRHVIFMYAKNGKEDFTEEELNNDVNETIIGMMMSNLVKEGFVEEAIDENGQIVYNNTEKGNNRVKDIDKESKNEENKDVGDPEFTD
jgi:hypothetical protein